MHVCPQVGDELLEINGNSTEGMLHSDTITIIKHGRDVVKLIIRRMPEEVFVGCELLMSKSSVRIKFS